MNKIISLSYIIIALFTVFVLIGSFASMFLYDIIYTESDIEKVLIKYQTDMNDIERTWNQENYRIKWMDNNKLCYLEVYNSYDDSLKNEKLLGSESIGNHFVFHNIIFYCEDSILLEKYFKITEQLK